MRKLKITNPEPYQSEFDHTCNEDCDDSCESCGAQVCIDDECTITVSYSKYERYIYCSKPACIAESVAEHECGKISMKEKKNE